MRNSGKLVIWPAYLDRGKSRRAGRNIARRFSIQSPTLGEIEEAARALGLDPITEPDKAYPRSWWETSGRVLITDAGPKSKLLKEIASRIATKRGS